MASILIKNAKSIVTCDDKDNVYSNYNILLDDGVIKYIGDEVKTADEVIDGSKYFVYPGLINTHHHLYQTFSRNLEQVQNMELFEWLITLLFLISSFLLIKKHG